MPPKKKNAKWWTLMQVKSRCYQESQCKKWQVLQNNKKPRSVSEHTKRLPKSYDCHWPEGSQNHASPKVWGLLCKIEFFIVASDLFFWPRVNECQPERGPRESPGAPRKLFRNFREGQGGQEEPRTLSKRGPGGGAQRRQKSKDETDI